MKYKVQYYIKNEWRGKHEPELCVAVVVRELVPDHAVDDVKSSSDWREDGVEDRHLAAISVASIATRKQARELIDEGAGPRKLFRFSVPGNDLKIYELLYSQITINCWAT